MYDMMHGMLQESWRKNEKGEEEIRPGSDAMLLLCQLNLIIRVWHRRSSISVNYEFRMAEYDFVQQ